jgi:hypothetical protein
MGHNLPLPVWPTVVAAVARHADRADHAERADRFERTRRPDARMAP